MVSGDLSAFRSKMSTGLSASCLKREIEPASEMLCFFKKLDEGQSTKKRFCQWLSAVTKNLVLSG